MEELHISTQQYSYIIAAYSRCLYPLCSPSRGMSLIFWGPKLAMPSSPSPGRYSCGSTALAGSWGGLALARGAVGAAEAAMIPAGLKASSEWFPAKERSIAVGYFNVGSSIGAMIAPPLVVWAIVMHSWQMAFIISGVLSFAWAIAWLIFYKHPRDQKNYLTKNVTTSLAVRSLSIRPITRRKCRRGKSCATVSSGVSPCRASSPSRPGDL
ncbi:MFS transporter [Klebsiella pneumoniae subsp. pneumoniae]|nr:MFS transporter [Klebsiella pneumoniae subsp. pneumoniae]